MIIVLLFLQKKQKRGIQSRDGEDDVQSSKNKRKIIFVHRKRKIPNLSNFDVHCVCLVSVYLVYKLHL